MTREEAIALFEKQLTAAQVVLDSGFGSNPGENNSLYRRRKEMAEIALSALRPVSRERVEKVWRAHWNESTHLGGFVYCSRCGYSALEANNYTFCPKCGSLFTDEAVKIRLKELEALKDE